MDLTPLQLECMKLWADMTLSFGCMLVKKFDDWSFYYNIIARVEKEYNYDIDMYYSTNWYNIPIWEYEIIWHPLTRWRLCYLRTASRPDNEEQSIEKMKKWMILYSWFNDNPEFYQQNIVEWDEETIKLVKDFLISIQ